MLYKCIWSLGSHIFCMRWPFKFSMKLGWILAYFPAPTQLLYYKWSITCSMEDGWGLVPRSGLPSFCHDESWVGPANKASWTTFDPRFGWGHGQEYSVAWGGSACLAHLLNQVWLKQSGKGVPKMACINFPLTMKGGLIKWWMSRYAIRALGQASPGHFLLGRARERTN